MSEPNSERQAFFADYEVYSFGVNMTWGSLIVTSSQPAGKAFDPEQVLAEVKEKASALHGVEPSDIRVRSLNRL